MRGNTLRLRLQRPEVEEFRSKGSVDEVTSFGPTPGKILTYSLVSDRKIRKVRATFEKNKISILVPEGLVKSWTETELIGFKEEMPVGNNQTLKILVEKDFKCLHERPGEDDTLAYQNPLN